MPDLSYPDISFRPLDVYDDVTSFHSTEQELDNFLHEDALDNQVNRLSVTFLANWNDIHVGYFSLVNDIIVAEAVHESDREPSWEYRKYLCFPVPALPALKRGIEKETDRMVRSRTRYKGGEDLVSVPRTRRPRAGADRGPGDEKKPPGFFEPGT